MILKKESAYFWTFSNNNYTGESSHPNNSKTEITLTGVQKRQ